VDTHAAGQVLPFRGPHMASSACGRQGHRHGPRRPASRPFL